MTKKIQSPILHFKVIWWTITTCKLVKCLRQEVQRLYAVVKYIAKNFTYPVFHCPVSLQEISLSKCHLLLFCPPKRLKNGYVLWWKSDILHHNQYTVTQQDLHVLPLSGGECDVCALRMPLVARWLPACHTQSNGKNAHISLTREEWPQTSWWITSWRRARFTQSSCMTQNIGCRYLSQHNTGKVNGWNA